MKKRVLLLVAMLLLFGSFVVQNFSNKNDTITVAGGVTSESQILGNIVVELLQHSTDKKIVYLNNLGSANLMHEAMLRGDLDIAPTRYTGTDLIGTLGLPTEKDPAKALKLYNESLTSDLALNGSQAMAFLISLRLWSLKKLPKI